MVYDEFRLRRYYQRERMVVSQCRGWGMHSEPEVGKGGPKQISGTVSEPLFGRVEW